MHRNLLKGAGLLTELLSGTDLSLLRGDRCLFKGLSFALDSGELMLLQGANGSGKTSLLRSIAGLISLESGVISWKGNPVSADRSAYSADIVLMGHRVGVKGDLTLVENLRFETGLRPASLARLDEVLERLALSRLTELPVRALSAGQQRRIALARMLISEAALWLMDEPLSNLDKSGQALVSELISEHLESDGACVLAAHQDIDIGMPLQRIQL